MTKLAWGVRGRGDQELTCRASARRIRRRTQEARVEGIRGGDDRGPKHHDSSFDASANSKDDASNQDDEGSRSHLRQQRTAMCVDWEAAISAGLVLVAEA